MAIRRKHISNITSQLLIQHSIETPAVDVEAIAIACGLKIHCEAIDDNISGLLVKNTNSQKFVIGVNANCSQSRQRFVIAHELGHALLHAIEPIHVDKKFAIDANTDDGEANIFALDLLMPAHFIDADLKEINLIDVENDNLIKELAKRYQVNCQLILLRLYSLGFINL